MRILWKKTTTTRATNSGSLLRRGLVGLSVALAAATIPVGVAAAPASGDKGGQTTCIGLFTGVAPHNLVVPTGKECFIFGAKVGGNVLVEKGALGFHSNNSTIGGSVLSPGAIGGIAVSASKVGHDIVVANTRFATDICRSTVGGNILLKNNAGETNVGSDSEGCAGGGGNTIGGNIIADKNSRLSITRNSVGKSVHINNNTGGGVIGPGNVIAHTLECQGNVPPPVSAGNTAHHFVGQCQH
jgi:hypothetical protein